MSFSLAKGSLDNWWLKNWPPVACFIITSIWFGFFACLGVDAHHDGIMLKPAIDVANGKVLFRETFTQYGALTTFFQVIAIKIFGPYLIVIRLSTVLFYSISIVLIYYIWRNFISIAYFWILFGLFLVLAPFYDWYFHPWSSVYALPFMLACNLFMFGFLRNRSGWYLCGAGASAALAFWCRQPAGIVLFLALIIYFAIFPLIRQSSVARAIRSFSICIISGICISSMFIIYLIVNDALKDWYAQSIRFSFSFGISQRIAEGGGTPNLLQCLFPIEGLCFIPVSEAMKTYVPLRPEFVLFPIATLIVSFICFNCLLRAKCDPERQTTLMLLFTALVGLASWHQYFPVPCQRHFYWGAIPMLGFYVLIIQKASLLRLRGLSQAVSRLLIVLLLLLPFHVSVTNFAKDVKFQFSELGSRKSFNDSILKDLLLSQGEYSFYESLRYIIENMPQETRKYPCLNLSEDGIFPLFFPNQDNYSPMYVNWGNTVYPDYFSRTELLIKERHVPIVSKKLLDIPGYALFAEIINVKPHLYFYLPSATKGIGNEGKP